MALKIECVYTQLSMADRKMSEIFFLHLDKPPLKLLAESPVAQVPSESPE